MKKLEFRPETQLTLFIGKDKSELYGELRADDYVINHHYERDFSKRFDLSQHEGKTLDVVINGNILTFEGKEIIEYTSVFDKGKVVDLGLIEKDGKKFAAAGVRSKLLAVIPLEELPMNLFKNRKTFKITVRSDDDWSVIRYANLHQHTEYSLLDGITPIKDLAKKSEYACAITDHGNMYGYLQFYKEMKKQNKKPIIGMEAYVETLGGPKKSFEGGSSEVDELMFDNVKTSTTSLNGEHLILLAKNEEGLKNLYHLTTEAEMHFHRKPHVTYDMLEKYHGGLIATSACIAGTLGQAIKTQIQIEDAGATETSADAYQANLKLADDFVDKMVSLFGADFYIEIQDHHFDLETRIMKRIREYAKKHGVKTTIGIDAHYLNKEDSKVHELWLCKQTKKTIDDPKHMRFSGDGYWVHTSEEVVSLFPEDIDAMDTTLDIADQCDVEIKFNGYHLPKYPLPEGEKTEFGYLCKLCSNGFQNLFGGTPTYEDPVYRERLKMELGTINKMGWPAYFLIVQDFIAYARDTDVRDHLERYFPSNIYDHKEIPERLIKDHEVYIGTGRGSAAGSLVCYCLGITKVDPIKYDLLFERFLNPDRISMPDIDTDFEDATREEVVDYCRYKYGELQVSKVITFGTAAAKAVTRDVVRILGKPVALGDKLSKMIPTAVGITLKSAMDQNAELKALYEGDAEVHEILSNALRLEGLPTSRSIHACATCIADAPIVGYMPQVLMTDPSTGSQFWTTQLTGPELEEMGLLKMDFLGLRTLGVAHEAVNLIKEYEGKDIVYDELPLNDVNVYEALEEGQTSAVFQAESELFTDTLRKVYSDLDTKVAKAEKEADPKKRKELLAKIGDECFNRMADTNALVRPGPQEYIGAYVENMLHPDGVTYDDPSEINQLSQTNGIMLYQEQMMILTRQMAGFSMGYSDKARKGTAKKKMDVLNELKEYFVHGSKEHDIKGCVANGIPESVAKKVWADMEKFGGYA
jgi:DNA polymerase-3 subunit alpha